MSDRHAPPHSASFQPAGSASGKPRHCRPCAGSEHARSDHPAEVLCSHAGGFRQGRSDTSGRTGSANLRLRGAADAGHPQPRPGQNRLQPAGWSHLLLIIPVPEDVPLGKATRQHWEQITGQCFDRGYWTVQRPIRRPHHQPRQHRCAGGALRRTQRTTPCHCQHLFPPSPRREHLQPVLIADQRTVHGMHPAAHEPQSP